MPQAKLSELNIAELRSLCRKSGYKGYHKLVSRVDLLEFIQAHETPDTPQECGICLTDFTNEVHLPCSHVMCFTCFVNHSRVSSVCPFCRQTFAKEVEKPAQISEMTDEAVSDVVMQCVAAATQGMYEAAIDNGLDDSSFQDALISSAATAVRMTRNWYE